MRGFRLILMQNLFFYRAWRHIIQWATAHGTISYSGPPRMAPYHTAGHRAWRHIIQWAKASSFSRIRDHTQTLHNG